MKHIKILILATLLLTSCTTQDVNPIYGNANSALSISFSNNNTTSSSSSPISVASSIDPQAGVIKKEIDKLFIETIKKQKEINGDLSMYQRLESLYSLANDNRRRKALYHMSLNPKLDEYLNNSFITQRMKIIMNDSTYVFIPEDPAKGFLIPYLITLPEERYRAENAKHKQYMFFEPSNHSDINSPWGNFNKMLQTRGFTSGYAMDMVPNQLYWPKVLSIMPQPALRNSSNNEFNMARLLNRLSVLATKDDYKDYFIFTEGNSSNNIIGDPDLIFNQYIFNQHIDVELQSRNIILDSQRIIRDLGYPIEDKIFMGGFSGSGAFTNRFATIYPEMLKGITHGGNLYPTLPGANYKQTELLFPLGVADNEAIFGRKFDLEKYNQVAKLEFFGKQEVWNYYPRDIIDNLDKKSMELFGRSSYSRLINKHKAYFELGGEKVTIVTTDVGHRMHANDHLYMKEFLILNRDSDKPVYPTGSPYSNHIYMSHFNQTNLDSEINLNPADFPPIYEGRILLFTSLVGNQMGGPHDEAAWKRFQDTIYLAPNLYEQSLLVDNNVFIVVYDTTMRSRLNLNDLKINITISPGEVVSTLNTDNKRVIVIYPEVDADGVKMIEELPSSITSVDQRYKR
jgi:hypothetical protein